MPFMLKIQWDIKSGSEADFRLANEKGQAPLGALIEASEKITCQCWGDPNDASREVLVGFGATYHETGSNSFLLNPVADKDSTV